MTFFFSRIFAQGQPADDRPELRPALLPSLPRGQREGRVHLRAQARRIRPHLRQK